MNAPRSREGELLTPRAAWLALLAGGLVPLACYLPALHPGLPTGDSGEFIAVAATGGIAHPPGYPLYTLLAGLFLKLVPAGSVAIRLNLLSALFGASAAAVLALAVTAHEQCRLRDPRPIPLLTGRSSQGNISKAFHRTRGCADPCGKGSFAVRGGWVLPHAVAPAKEVVH